MLCTLLSRIYFGIHLTVLFTSCVASSVWTHYMYLVDGLNRSVRPLLLHPKQWRKQRGVVRGASVALKTALITSHQRPCVMALMGLAVSAPPAAQPTARRWRGVRATSIVFTLYIFIIYFIPTTAYRTPVLWVASCRC